MAKAKAKAKAIDEGEETTAVAAVEVADGIVFVNREKLARAKDIVELVAGKRAPRTESEADQKERFTAHFASHEEEPKGKNAVRFVYETLLGGLVRTPEEQEAADENAVAAKAKYKKNAVGEKTGR